MEEKEVEKILEEVGGLVRGEVENVLYDVLRNAEEARAGSERWRGGEPVNTYKREIVKDGVDRIVQKLKHHVMEKIS